MQANRLIALFSGLFFLPLILFGQNSFDYFDSGVSKFSTNIDSAIHYFEDGIAHYKTQENWVKHLNCHNALASCYNIKGNYKKSYSYAQKAIKIANLHQDPSSVAYASALNNLAVFKQDKGEFLQAAELFKKALTVNKINNDKKAQVPNLNNLALCYFQSGDYQESKRYYQQALKVANEIFPINNSNRLRAIYGLGNIYKTQNKIDKALNIYEEVLIQLEIKNSQKPEMLAKINHEIQLSIAELFLIKKLKNNFFKNIKALDISHQIAYQKKSINGLILSGKWHLKFKDLELAKSNFHEALELARKENNEIKQSPRFGEIFYLLAQTILTSNHFEAISMCDSALYHFNIQLESDQNQYSNVTKNPTLDDNTLDILLTKAKLHFKQFEKTKDKKDIQKSLYTYTYATKLINQIRQSYLQEGSRETFVAKTKKLFEEALNTWDIYQKNFPTGKQYAQIFQLLENSKSMLLLQSLEAEEALGAAGIPDSLILKENELSKEISFYKIKLTEQSNGNTEKIAAIETDLFQVEATYQELIEQFEKNYPEYYNLKFNQKLTSLSEAKSQLPHNSTGLLNYFVGEKYLFTFFTTKTKTIFEKIEKPADFDTSILNLRKLIENPPVQTSAQKDFGDFSSLCFDMYKTLMNPIIAESKLENLIIIPDGILNYLPFEILLSDEPKNNVVNYQPSHLPYLLNKYNISYRYSASLHKVLNKTTTEAKSDFIGFAPSFSVNTLATQNARSCELESLSRLSCNKNEVVKIAGLLQGKTFVDKSASKENFNKEIQNFRIAHFATHACLDDEDPMLNRIFFANSSVSNYELYNLKLPLELAVLSACNTGSGELKKGEGVISLSRGFFHAGCPSLLMSLWSVEDCTTSEIMTNYYGYLKKGNSKDVAIRKAKLDYLDQANKLGSHPFYWAPFIQLGSIEPITLGGGNKTFIFLLLSLLVFSFGFYLYKRNQNT